MEKKKVTLSGNPPDENYNGGAPQPINPETGMHRDYWVLPEEDRNSGFVRPIRNEYRHVGIRPKYETRDLTEEEKEQYKSFDYILFEKYPESESPKTGRFWTKKQLNSGCNKTTIMHTFFAETYAKDPKYYTSTFCAYCGVHLPVGEDGEFEWLDGSKVGT